MRALKEALDFDEQIKRLRDVHALEINDEEQAKEILAKVNYYRLSAYGIGLTRPEDKEKYFPCAQQLSMFDT